MIPYSKISFWVRPTRLEPLLGPFLRRQELRQWRKAKIAPAPAAVKHEMIRQAAARLQEPVLVETGTFFGDTTQAVAHAFQKIYTIELSEELARKAQARFAHEPKIDVLQGDSGVILQTLLPAIHAPIVFWLDAHYSRSVTARGDKDSPIVEELETICRLCRFPCILLIDDARLFGRAPSYPTVAEAGQLIARHHPDYRLINEDDVIQVDWK